MPLGESGLRSERIRTPGDLPLDDPGASHACAWLYRHQPATVEDYVETVDANERQSRLAAIRLEAHDLLERIDGIRGRGDPGDRRGGPRHDPARCGVPSAVIPHLAVHPCRTMIRPVPSATAAEPTSSARRP
jgi:hypothetical protein